MMLRSSSTPILGSLVPHSDSTRENVGKISPSHENANRISFHSTPSHNYSQSRSLDTCSVDVEKGAKSVSSLRRVQSEGNLESVLSKGSSVQAKVAAESFLQSGSDDYNLPSWSRRRSAQRKLPYLASVPSFNMYCDEEDEEEDEGLENFTDIYKVESNMQGFSFGNKGVGKIGVNSVATSGGESDFVSTEPMFMARGLGMGVMEPLTDTGGGGGNSTHKGISSTGGEGDGNGGGFDNIEEHYQKTLEQNPANSLILGNYAQFLYETKRDCPKAEEYYARAILAQPGDGEVLAQYAKLIWELHRDEERANAYFEQAVQAAPADRKMKFEACNYIPFLRFIFCEREILHVLLAWQLGWNLTDLLGLSLSLYNEANIH